MAKASDSAKAREAATQIVRTLRSHGHTAYFAGGCVRDELLGLDPTDFDVATDATPDRIRAIFPRTDAVGAAFGVILVHIGRVNVEVATFRSDGTYSDSRRPDAVTFSDAGSDARRRDFTVNALFLDPLADPSHRVIDLVGGVADLGRKLIRAVGEADQRLAEDHLRALRAVRFAARLGFDIDPPTADAIRRHTLELGGVSRERIGDELRRVLAHPSRARALSMLQDLGLDAPVLNQPSSKPPIRLAAAMPSQAPFSLLLAAWLLDRGLTVEPSPVDEAVARLRLALCLSNHERDDLGGILHGLRTLESPWGSSTIARRKRAAASRWFPSSMVILTHRHPQAAAAIQADVAILAATPPGLAPPPLLTGDDLVAAGHRPGPAFRHALETVYDAQLEGRITDKPGALELARSLGV